MITDSDVIKKSYACILKQSLTTCFSIQHCWNGRHLWHAAWMCHTVASRLRSIGTHFTSLYDHMFFFYVIPFIGGYVSMSCPVSSDENPSCFAFMYILTHWGRVTHICVDNLTIIASDNDSSLGRRQVIIWTNAGILLIRTLGTNFNDNSIDTHAFSFEKMQLNDRQRNGGNFCRGLNALTERLPKLKIVIFHGINLLAM